MKSRYRGDNLHVVTKLVSQGSNHQLIKHNCLLVPDHSPEILLSSDGRLLEEMFDNSSTGFLS